jgi:hypothetical protein
MTDLPATTQSTDEKRSLALLKAIGLDRAAPEQRELALAIAARYDLDLMLKHLVLIEGRPYITRDGLLHIAHRSGVLDGIETSEPTVVDDYWRVSCSVYRKDMSRPFTYYGRYPTKGGNQKFAPEMATKVAESMAMRRAFDVAAPSQDERWDVESASANYVAPPQQSLAEKAAAKRAEVETPQEATVHPLDAHLDADATPEPVSAPEPSTDATVCGAVAQDGLMAGEVCTREPHDKGAHKNANGSWPLS